MTGIPAALAAAVLFGVATPLAKLLLTPLDPWLLAGVLDFGSGIGLALVRRIRVERRPGLGRQDVPRLLAALGCGGLIQPVLLMWGLARTSASVASLLLNKNKVGEQTIHICSSTLQVWRPTT